MGDPQSVTMLCRVLLGLDRASASGTLFLRGQGQSACLSLEAGAVVGANIDRRVASSARQLLEGVIDLCAWSDLGLRFVEEPATTSWWKLAQPIAARTIALDCMRARLTRVDASEIRCDLGRGNYHLTPSGEALLVGAELRPEETAVLFRLRRGVSAENVETLPGCGLPGYRFLWMLKRLGAAAPKACGSYPLLLRKRREMRRRASAHVLLDLPEGAKDGEARKALRKLVRDLHPDRFGEGVPAALRRASGEIVTALVDAEATLASDRPD